MKLITVYGSLLKGLHNWKYFLDNSKCTFLGSHIIEGNFDMLNLGGFPGLIASNKTNRIFVETYRVSDSIYQSIEFLEGYNHLNGNLNMYNKLSIETPFGDSELYIYNTERNFSPIFVEPNEEGIINWREFKNGR